MGYLDRYAIDKINGILLKRSLNQLVETFQERFSSLVCDFLLVLGALRQPESARYLVTRLAGEKRRLVSRNSCPPKKNHCDW